VGRDFEVRQTAEVPATPDQIWAAIATGPGIDSWFMGRNEVAGGTVRTAFGGYNPESTVTAWEPSRHLSYGGERAPDGRFIAYEFLIEARGGGSTILRAVTSGFLPGEDWEAEYEAMGLGLDLFFRTLVEYLTYFPGRTATPITAFGPAVTDWDEAWATLHRELGRADPAEGDRVRFSPPGRPPVDGVVYARNPHTLGVRTDDALYRFLRGLPGFMMAGHHLFFPVPDPDATEAAWRTWLTRLYG
jgi:uncharacterized protein YndB with AHSA1/START domain